jgi:hypothetical protein
MPDHPHDRRRRRRQSVTPIEAGGAQFELTLRVLRHTRPGWCTACRNPESRRGSCVSERVLQACPRRSRPGPRGAVGRKLARRSARMAKDLPPLDVELGGPGRPYEATHAPADTASEHRPYPPRPRAGGEPGLAYTCCADDAGRSPRYRRPDSSTPASMCNIRHLIGVWVTDPADSGTFHVLRTGLVRLRLRVLPGSRMGQTYSLHSKVLPYLHRGRLVATSIPSLVAAVEGDGRRGAMRAAVDANSTLILASKCGFQRFPGVPSLACGSRPGGRRCAPGSCAV